MRIHRKYSLLFLFSLLTISITFSQKVIDNDANKIIFKAPNENFNDIEIQTFNGLIRLGTLNNDPLETYKNKNTDYYAAYKQMLVFNDHQKNDWDSPYSTRENVNLFDNYNTNPKAVKAYNIISKLLPYLSKKGKIKYFGSERPHGYGQMSWVGESKFAKSRIYKSFISENLDDLKKWAKNFTFKNDQTAYYVTQDLVTDYDFENEGIIISLGFHNIKDNNRILRKLLDARKPNMRNNAKHNLTGAFFSDRSLGRSSNIGSGVTGELKYVSKNTFEKDISDEFQVVFFPIGQEKANEILKNRVIYIVRKIKINKDYSFNIQSPIIELFADKALTKKIGTLNYNDLIFY